MSALPRQAVFTPKPIGVPCKRKTVVISAQNKTTFSPSDTADYYLPSLPNQVLDGQTAYLRGVINITGANVAVDGTFHSLIDNIQTFGSGGQLISNIQNYGVLASMLNDVGLSASAKVGLSTVLGCESDMYAYSSSNLNTSAPITSFISNNNRSGASLTSGSSYSFCIPIIHPLFSLSQRYFPCYAMNDSTRVSITWASVINAFYSAGSPGYTLTNPEIVCEMLEFDDSVMAHIRDTYKGVPLAVPSFDYAAYSSLISAGSSGTVTNIMSLPYSSALMMLFAFRPSETQIQGAYSTSSRVNPMFSANDTFQLVVGNTIIPQKPIKTLVANDGAAYFSELQKAFQAWNDPTVMNGNITKALYNVAPKSGYSTGANSYLNAFTLALNLDTLRNQDSAVSGLDLSKQTVRYEAYIGTAPLKTDGSTQQSITVNTFCLFNCQFIVDELGNTTVQR
jgi:hypothetical protein